ncbi:unnamed protein product [Phytophthora fragariaefolia]|uniref:Unnamed protein product n=1 Tax=Phytophthora fragariaefolia TaxID=1490495 RepID=A0A9W7CZD3_9STRA|nr:unnamed protein product [Phytophthora fragariaefolia]
MSEGSSLSEWVPSPSPSRAESTETTSSASENGGQREIVAPPPRETQFPSWEAFEAYLAVYQAESFQNTLQTVNVLRKAGAKKTNILKFITDNSNSNPKPQDVHNLVRKLKTRENDCGPTTSAQRLKKWMAGFGEVPGDVGRIFVDKVDGKKVATCITLQTNPSTEQTRTLEPANESAFEISSPPKARGRPKRTAKSQKTSRNKAGTMAADDSDMFALNMSLENVQVAVNNQPSYTSSETLLTRFKMFEIAKKSRQPIAHKISSLSASKQVTCNGAITRIFRVDLIERCLDKVAALQKKETAAGRQNLAEQQAVVEIIGIYSTNTIRTMKKWHQAMKSIRLVDKAISWVDTITFTLTMSKGFQVEPNPELASKLKSIPLLTSQLVGKTALGDCTVNMLMAKIFADRADTIGVDTSVAGNVINGYLPIQSMQGVFTGLKQEKVLIPVICGRNHWCSIMIDLTLKEVCIYDPMASSYTLRVRSLAENLLGFLPDFAPRKYRVRLYVSELGVQVDSYNCRIYMMTAFEMFAGADKLKLLSKKDLQYLRSRYLCMCV